MKAGIDMTINPLIYSSQEHSLEVLVQSGAIHYSVLDENEHCIVRQEINLPPGRTGETAVFEQFFNQPEMNIPGENVRIVMENSRYQVVPSELFREQQMELLFDTEHGVEEQEQIIFNLLPRLGMHFVFAIPKHITAFLQEKYPEAAIEHHLEKLLKRRVHTSEDQLHAIVRSEAVDLILVKNRSVELISSNETAAREDVVYYILNLYEQLELDANSFPVRFHFSDKVDSELIEILETFLGNVKKQ